LAAPFALATDRDGYVPRGFVHGGTTDKTLSVGLTGPNTVRDAMVKDSDEEKASTFYYNGMGSLAKSLAFHAMAKHAQKNNERVNSTVSIYYSFLHLAICLMYFCPNKMDNAYCDNLLQKRDGGESDPTKEIKHCDAINFVKNCKRDGLREDFCSQLKLAKKLREFVNYGPRITLDNGKPYFGPCDFGPSDCDKLVSSYDEIYKSSILWAKENSPLNGALVVAGLEQCEEFFQKNELFYKRWCSDFTIRAALDFLKQ